MLNFIAAILVSFTTSGNVKAESCEVMKPRLDGVRVEICGGSVRGFYDVDGSYRRNVWSTDAR